MSSASSSGSSSSIPACASCDNANAHSSSRRQAMIGALSCTLACSYREPARAVPLQALPPPTYEKNEFVQSKHPRFPAASECCFPLVFRASREVESEQGKERPRAAGQLQQAQLHGLLQVHSAYLKQRRSLRECEENRKVVGTKQMRPASGANIQDVQSEYPLPPR